MISGWNWKFSRLISKNSEPLEHAVIAFLRTEEDFKNTMQYCAVTTLAVRRNNKALDENFISEMKKNPTDKSTRESEVQGSLNKFPDFFRMGTFIDSTHIKL